MTDRDRDSVFYFMLGILVRFYTFRSFWCDVLVLVFSVFK